MKLERLGGWINRVHVRSELRGTLVHSYFIAHFSMLLSQYYVKLSKILYSFILTSWFLFVYITIIFKKIFQPNRAILETLNPKNAVLNYCNSSSKNCYFAILLLQKLRRCSNTQKRLSQICKDQTRLCAHSLSLPLSLSLSLFLSFSHSLYLSVSFSLSISLSFPFLISLSLFLFLHWSANK